jgi:hypothetical protein
MQIKSQEAGEPSQAAAERRVLLSKLLISAVRAVLYFLSIRSNSVDLSNNYINILIGTGLYLLLLSLVWYYSFGFASPQGPFSTYLTVLMHVSGLANMVLFALSIKL